MWEILIFKMIYGLENSNKFQKTTVWKEKSVDNVVTFEGLPFNSKHDFISYLAVQKNRYIHCKTMFTC
jgi:hypothetical protein